MSIWSAARHTSSTSAQVVLWLAVLNANRIDCLLDR